MLVTSLSELDLDDLLESRSGDVGIVEDQLALFAMPVIPLDICTFFPFT